MRLPARHLRVHRSDDEGGQLCRLSSLPRRSEHGWWAGLRDACPGVRPLWVSKLTCHAIFTRSAVAAILLAGCGSRAELLAPGLDNGGGAGDAALVGVPAAAAADTGLATPEEAASPEAAPPAETAPPEVGDAASAGCIPVGGGAAGPINGECTANFGKTCGSTSYQVSCSCPDGYCVCFGASTHAVRFTGCPYCPGSPAQAFALCGFPSGWL